MLLCCASGLKKLLSNTFILNISYSQLTPTTCRTCAIGKSVLLNKFGTGNKRNQTGPCPMRSPTFRGTKRLISRQYMGSSSQKQYLIVSSAESQNARLAATSAELKRSLMLCPYLVASLATSRKYATGIFTRQSVYTSASEAASDILYGCFNIEAKSLYKIKNRQVLSKAAFWTCLFSGYIKL